MLLDMRQKMPFFHHFVTTLWQEFKKKALPLHQQKRDCNKDNVKKETRKRGSIKERKETNYDDNSNDSRSSSNHDCSGCTC